MIFAMIWVVYEIAVFGLQYEGEATVEKRKKRISCSLAVLLFVMGAYIW